MNLDGTGYNSTTIPHILDFPTHAGKSEKCGIVVLVVKQFHPKFIVLQKRAVEIRLYTDERSHVGSQLQVQHFFNKNFEDEIEHFFIRIGRRAARRSSAGPEAAGVKITSLAVDLVQTVNGIQRGHVQRDRKQFDIDRCLGNRFNAGKISSFEFRIRGFLFSCRHSPVFVIVAVKMSCLQSLGLRMRMQVNCKK